MFKPVAFCISKELVPNVKFYSETIKRHIINSQIGYQISIWYTGDFPDNSKKIKFSFPQNEDLLDKNLIITIESNSITVENDWLGSIPVFYNKNETIISTIPNICLKDKSLDEEGLMNFSEFGYSVFEQTPFKDVNFLRFYSLLILEKDSMKIELKDDPILTPGLFEKQSTSSEAIDVTKQYINRVESKIPGKILLPSSGGYDSRLLNWAINNKTRINGFTYGISKNQKKSYEVVFAKKISEILNINWEQIELSHFHDYIDDWHRLFGFSTHLHGMYHIEFYKKILEKHNFDENVSFLSGIFGDVWAGSIDKLSIKSPNDIKKLAFTHGMDLDEKFWVKSKSNDSIEKYFDKNYINLQSHQVQVVSTVRMKIMLISYLFRVPEYFGIPVWTPFLNFNVATTMLRLPKEIKKNRKWQKDFFKGQHLDIENMNLSYSKTNFLNHTGSNNFYFEPIRSERFKNIININMIDKLNNRINKHNHIIEFVLTRMKLRSVLRRIGIKKIGFTESLSNYYILKALEKSAEE